MIIASIKEQCEADVNLEDELNEEEDQTFTSIEASDWTTTRNEHLKKITDPAKKIVEVVPRASAESTPLTGRWVDSCGDDGVFKSRWTTHGFKQELNGTETHHSGTPATAHIKALLIDAALQGYVAALGDCSGAFYQAPLQERVWLEAPPEANLPEGYAWRALCAFPGLKGAPRAWEDHSANVLAQLGMDRSKYDGCVFWARPKATKAGKHVDDFVVTGPQEPVEELLKVMKDRPNLRDIIRLYREGDEGTLLSMNVRKIEGGYAVKGKDSLIVDAAEILHLEGANTVRTPENTNEKWGPEDDIPLGIGPHRDYRTCVGKLLHLAKHRSDIQHGVGVLSQKLSKPTLMDQKRLKKMARYLVGARGVYLKLVPDPRAAPVDTYVDADWADSRTGRRSTSGGAILYHGCPSLTWARRQAVYAPSSAESELYAIGTGSVESIGFAQLLHEWGEEVVPRIHSDSQSALAVCKRRGPGKMKHVELKLLAVQQ